MLIHLFVAIALIFSLTSKTSAQGLLETCVTPTIGELCFDGTRLKVSPPGAAVMGLPLMTTAQRIAIASPAAGDMVFDTTLGQSFLFSGGQWASNGTVTSVSVVSANGFAGTVATATTTPAITVSTSITGLLNGNGTAISAAVAGTDYLTTGTLPANVSSFDALTGAVTSSVSLPLVKTVVGNDIGFTCPTCSQQSAALIPNQIVFPDATGQLTGSATFVRDPVTGFVGIGTTNPGTKTEISGSSGVAAGGSTPIALRISATDQDAGANTWNTTAPFTALQFYSADASAPSGASVRAQIGAVMEAVAGQTSALTLYTQTAGTPLERMRIDSAGNVGIGTTNPGAKLHAVTDDATTNATTNILTIDHTTSGVPASGIGAGILLRAEDSVGTTENAVQLGGILTTVTDGSEASAFTISTRTAGGALAEKVRVNSTGLGVGVSPLDRIHAEGTSNTYIRIASSGANTLDRGIRFTNQAGNNAGFIILTPNTVGTDSSMGFWVGGANSIDQRVKIQNDGNVAVGVALAPALARFHVAGGDVLISTAANGVILKSPDAGTCARITIADSTGVLVSTIITCP